MLGTQSQHVELGRVSPVGPRAADPTLPGSLHDMDPRAFLTSLAGPSLPSGRSGKTATDPPA